MGIAVTLALLLLWSIHKSLKSIIEETSSLTIELRKVQRTSEVIDSAPGNPR
jgi:hypothetical protein